MSARWSFDAIGVGWHIDTAEPLPEGTRAAVAGRIDAYDRTWSRYRDDSLVARIAREPGVWDLPPEAGALLELYRVLYSATAGRLSPLARRGAAAPAWDDAIAWTPAGSAQGAHRGGTLSAPRPVDLDVAAAGKGQLADLVSDVLIEHGFPEHTVDASGDIRRLGPAIRVALEHPLDSRLAIGVVELGDGAIAASGQNRQPGHIVDALTGTPVRTFIASWAIAQSAAVADGAATAVLLVEDPAAVVEALAPGYGQMAWARLDSHGRLDASSDFEAELFA